MIIRVSEAHVRAGMRREFMAALGRLVRDFPDQHDGLLDHEVLVDRADPDRVLYVSRWRDAAALASYAGADWPTTAVTFPAEDTLLRGPLSVRHFSPDEGDPVPR